MDKTEGLSRRGVLHGLGMFGISYILGGKPRASCAKPRKPKAFALIGDRWHNSEFIRVSLRKSLCEEAGLEVDFTDEVTCLSGELLKGYDIVIFFRNGVMYPRGFYGPYSTPVPDVVISDPPVSRFDETPVNWMTDIQGKALKEFVGNGGGALIYHDGCHISLTNQDYLDVAGASHIHHPGVRPYKVFITNPDHPIVRGVRDFIVTDQQTYITYHKETGGIFMMADNMAGIDFQGHGSTSICGFAHEYGRGRVCFLAPGHTITAVWNPEYLKIQKNAVRWLLNGE